MTPEIKQRIENLIAQHSVVLFMKGTKASPQCGFSRSVVEVLQQVAHDFATFDILSDPEMREGIKTFSSWPTIPQLYINQEFVGGCDIVLDLFKNNELQGMLGAQKATSAPHITISDRALSALKNAAHDNETSDPVRLSIGADFGHGLSFDEKNSDDFVLTFAGLELVVDPYSAHRAHNLTMDYVEDTLDSGFSFDNPNAPAEVQELSVHELNEWRLSEKDHVLLDVRTKAEWEQAHITGAQLVDDLSPGDIETLDKTQTIVLHCHHGGRSRKAAEAFKARGFKHVYNLVGGIDAWSKQIDKSVPVYS